jgi:hypothetical protein
MQCFLLRKNNSLDVLAEIEGARSGSYRRATTETEENMENNVKENILSETEEDIEHSIASVLDLVEETKAEIMNNSVKLELLNQRHSEEVALLLRKQSKEVGKISEQHTKVSRKN